MAINKRLHETKQFVNKEVWNTGLKLTAGYLKRIANELKYYNYKIDNFVNIIIEYHILTVKTCFCNDDGNPDFDTIEIFSWKGEDTLNELLKEAANHYVDEKNMHMRIFPPEARLWRKATDAEIQKMKKYDPLMLQDSNTFGSWMVVNDNEIKKKFDALDILQSDTKMLALSSQKLKPYESISFMIETQDDWDCWKRNINWRILLSIDSRVDYLPKPLFPPQWVGGSIAAIDEKNDKVYVKYEKYGEWLPLTSDRLACAGSEISQMKEWWK